jgi:CheY-like chemotaxis protein
MERLNLLLADDDSDDCSFFEEAVAEIAPHSTIQIKKDGEEVLKYLFNPHSILPDVIFLDMNMPFIDGVKCLEEIRYNSKMNNIFIVMNTTTASPKDIELSYEKGANLFLIKPNSYFELKKSIATILKLDFKSLILNRHRDNFVFNPNVSRDDYYYP